MKKKTWLLILFAFFAAILAIFLFSIFGVRRRIDLAQTSGETLYQIFEERKVGQTFQANHNHLNVIILDLRNGQLRNKEPLFFHLKDLDNNQEIRAIEISGLNVGDPGAVRFQFEPIPDSAGKNYYFYLESPSSTTSDAIEIFHSENDVYPQGEMNVNGEALSGDLRFITNYYPGSKAILAQETINDFFSRFFTDKCFVLFYLVLLLAVFSLAIMV